jgi:hypothetical protein
MTLPTVTLITPTGWRQQGFSLAEKYVARQTYKGPIQWIVMSDDKEDSPTVCTMGQEYYPCSLKWKPGLNTQRYQFAEALPRIKGDLVLIWEDDDYFKPDYIAVMVDFLKYADLVGECDVTYYSLITKGFREMNNRAHASLTQTGFRRSYLPQFERAVHSGQTFMDIALWTTAKGKAHKNILFSGLNLCLGIKGLGRKGIGFGHQETTDFIADHSFVKLRTLIGIEDAKAYTDIMGGK